MPKRYNTPHRSRVVKTRLSEEEYADFTARLAPYGISQSEFLRQAIRRTAIRPIIHVSAVNDELLSAVGKLTAEYGRIGGNRRLAVAALHNRDFVVWTGHFVFLLSVFGHRKSRIPFQISCLLCRWGRRVFSNTFT